MTSRSRNPAPPKVLLDNLSPHQIKKVVELGLLVVKEMARDNAYGAYEIIDSVPMELEEKLAFWSLLDSEQRSIIKSLDELAHK